MNFATMKGLTIPEGVVTQITDASGRVLWALSGGGPIVLQVEKITSDTYAAETTYTAEEFILLYIYPKTNGTVSVTYGGLTKTITDTSGAEIPNAQKVFFGTFNGVSDSVTTPASGELTIEGDYESFATVSFFYTSKNSKYCGCITSVVEWGNLKTIGHGAFRGCSDLTSVSIPSSVTSIGDYAFYDCTGLTSVSIPSSVTSIGDYAFYDCTGLTSVSIPSSVTSIGSFAFQLSGLKSVYVSDMYAWCKIKFMSSWSPGNYSLYLNNALVTHVEIPTGVTEIAYTFQNCASLQSISFPSGFTTIGDFAFSYCIGLQTVSLPSGLTTIGDSAFYECSSLALTSLPNGLASIGNNAFYNCWSISIGEIPEGVTFIGESAFRMNAYLDANEYNMPSTIVLPSTIAEIGEYAFAYSAKGDPIYGTYVDILIIRATTPPIVGAYSFGSHTDEGHYPDEILVPVGCGEAYKVAEIWSYYESIIEEGA